AVWVFFPEEIRRPERGELLDVRGRLERPRPPRNPGAFDFESYLEHRGIRSVLSAESAERLEGPANLPGVASWIRKAIAARVKGEKGALLTGLMLGDSSLLPDELLSSFRRAGTVHVLAVSGLHVGFIALMAHTALRCLRAPPRLARLLVLPFLLLFVCLVGPRPSVVRASLMAGAVILAWTAERRVNPLNTIGAAALAILLVRPGSLFDAGFGLSFGATLGIVLLFPSLGRAFSGLRRLGRPGGLLADSLALSVAAQIGVAPVSVATFGQISVIAPLANLAAVPLAALSVASGVVMLMAWPVPPLSRLMGGAAWASLSSLALAADAADCTISALSIGSRYWPVAAVLALGMSLARLRALRGRARLMARASVLAVAALVALLLWSFGPGRSAPRMIVFDVGQGDAILLELPRSRRVLVDAGVAWGGASGWDAGAAIVLPYLRRRGIGSLDALVVTHGHRDHYGGAAAVIRECPPAALVLPVGYERSQGLRRTAGIARELGVPVRAVESGDTLLSAPGCLLKVLSPLDARRPAGNENDRSIVIRAEIGPAAALLTGDAEKGAEASLVESGAPLRSDLLKVAHHGSASSSIEPFLGAVGPGLAVVSVGEGNRYGHPDEAALARLRASGAAVMRTDRDGAVVVDVSRSRAIARGYVSGVRHVVTLGAVRRATGPQGPGGRRGGD
ncbi:MAG: DNA internalization-related competence protein ComEC/Rec2, partial [Candidatus Eisenbacteria bacterium]|nr:DNA internalization-related competence protein ComEC/Rec2 [Candidatus Eisenbacteria bacterium]